MISVQSRHADCIQFQDPGESLRISDVNFNTNESIPNNKEFLSVQCPTDSGLTSEENVKPITDTYTAI